ncbi:CLUMA_CG005363, isoform A [Clunio marinus]|uniref:CLUMA_CG005363, isoform A n=1 Tax=Clunio marinus TaxID=568069 RepID=A0A1J1HUH9_9DIPT|nr:CLUMA_CG005363, isoform A [Clunio marinus]
MKKLSDEVVRRKKENVQHHKDDDEIPQAKIINLSEHICSFLEIKSHYTPACTHLHDKTKWRNINTCKIC